MKNYIAIFFILIGLTLTVQSLGQDTRIQKNFDKGTILIFAEEELNDGNEYDITSRSYQQDIAGIATGNNNPIKRNDIIITDGVAYVRCNSENGIIKKGDTITSSSQPGVGMKATDSGIILGIALEDANEKELVKTRILIQYMK